MQRLILFYKYVTITDPEATKAWLRTQCVEQGLRGRIIVAPEGINGTLGGATERVELFIAALEAHELFGGIDYKESDGGAYNFPRLRVVVKHELINFRVPRETVAPELRGIYLSPAEAHQLMANPPDDLVIFDTRNRYESCIGTFKNAITPDITHFRDLPAYLAEHKEQLANKRVLMFCTGGIRCEPATAYLNSQKIAREVYHIRGGIHRYVEQYPDGFFRGKNYVFDSRVGVRVTDDVLGCCDHCKKPWDTYSNCLNAFCNKQILLCPECMPLLKNCCSTACVELVTTGQVVVRKCPRNNFYEQGL